MQAAAAPTPGTQKEAIEVDSVVRKDAALTAEAVLAYCRDKLAGYKRPQAVEFVDEIPRNPSGKILKRILREQYPGSAPR